MTREQNAGPGSHIKASNKYFEKNGKVQTLGKDTNILHAN